MVDPVLLDPLAPARVRQRLAGAARRALRRAEGPVVRVAVPVAMADPLAWLSAQPSARRFFWRGRGEAAAFAAAGEALGVEAADLDGLQAALTPLLDTLPDGARFFGHGRFASDEAPFGDGWAPFGRVRFVLPRLVLQADGEGAVLALHLVEGEGFETVKAALGALVFPAPPLSLSLPTPHRRADAPDREGWREAVTEALRQFGQGPLEKVVLARRTSFAFDTPLDPFALLARLRAATPGCYHALAGAGDAAFVSATPERLLRVDGRRVATEAVAGTRPRAAEAEADARLRDALLTSEKDRREHAYVRDGIAAALAPLTACLDGGDETATLTLARGRHLYTRLCGTLRAGATALDALRALHPTPAVGGTPTAEALAAIRACEPFDRGLYAGPIGWVGRDAAELAVGIRSGCVRPSSDGGTLLDLFAGAGIVSGSDPAAEWAEIEHKIGDFLRVLGMV